MATPSHAQWRRGGGEASLPRRVARIRSVLIYYECAEPARGLRGACAEPARNLRLRAARHALVSLQNFDGHLQVTHDSLELAYFRRELVDGRQEPALDLLYLLTEGVDAAIELVELALELVELGLDVARQLGQRVFKIVHAGAWAFVAGCGIDSTRFDGEFISFFWCCAPEFYYHRRASRLYCATGFLLSPTRQLSVLRNWISAMTGAPAVCTAQTDFCHDRCASRLYGANGFLP